MREVRSRFLDELIGFDRRGRETEDQNDGTCHLQKIALIQEIIESEIRPGLQADGGDVELIDIEENKVVIAFRGMCAGCVKSGMTIEGIQAKLRELVSEDLIVETQ